MNREIWQPNGETEMAKKYDVVWDIEDQTKIKSYESRNEAYDKFKSLREAPGVVAVTMQTFDGRNLHWWQIDGHDSRDGKPFRAA
jgi:hypothetical protein